MKHILKLLLAFVLSVSAVKAEEVGTVDTAWNLFGNHHVVVEVFDDPKVKGATCYVSRAKTGGITGKLGLATDKSDASVACRQVGPISFVEAVPPQEEVFKSSASILFKTVKVIRLVDTKRNVLIYLIVSTKLVDGSPKNSVTAIALPPGTKIALAQ